MVKTVEVEVWVLIDSDGDYVAHEDVADLNDAYADRLQNLDSAEGLRRIKITVTVPVPDVIELKGSFPDDPRPSGLNVKVS